MRALFTAVCLALACAGCTKVDLDHPTITAEDGSAFSSWRRRFVTQLPPAQQAEFEAALEEIRVGIMLKHEASGREGIEAAVRQRVHARTVRQVLLSADELKLMRLVAERSDLQRVVNANAQLLTKPGDRAAASDLEQYRAKLQQRIDAASAEIKAAEQRVIANGGTPPAHPENFTPAAPTAVMSREAALKEIATLIEGRRMGGTLKHGEWPVKIDRTGASLSEKEAREFSERKAAAESAGRIVIPIRLKEHWLFYEGVNQAPQLPPSVSPNLTSDDLRKYTEDWVNVEAERWARDVVAALPSN